MSNLGTCPRLLFAIDAISTFPEDVRRPNIKVQKKSQLAIQLQISGDLNEVEAKAFAEQVRQELLRETIVNSVNVWGVRPYEISVEVNRLSSNS